MFKPLRKPFRTPRNMFKTHSNTFRRLRNASEYHRNTIIHSDLGETNALAQIVASQAALIVGLHPSNIPPLQFAPALARNSKPTRRSGIASGSAELDHRQYFS